MNKNRYKIQVGGNIIEIQEQSTNVKLEENFNQKDKLSLNLQIRISISSVLKRIADLKNYFGLDDTFLNYAKKDHDLKLSF